MNYDFLQGKRIIVRQMENSHYWEPYERADLRHFQQLLRQIDVICVKRDVGRQYKLLLENTWTEWHTVVWVDDEIFWTVMWDIYLYIHPQCYALVSELYATFTMTRSRRTLHDWKTEGF